MTKTNMKKVTKGMSAVNVEKHEKEKLKIQKTLEEIYPDLRHRDIFIIQCDYKTITPATQVEPSSFEGEKEENHIKISRTPVLIGGKFTGIPMISGNSFRGAGRRALTAKTLKVLELHEELNLMVDSFFRTGNSRVGKMKPFSRELINYMHDIVWVDLLGGYFEGQYFEGALRVTDILPLVSELKETRKYKRTDERGKPGHLDIFDIPEEDIPGKDSLVLMESIEKYPRINSSLNKNGSYAATKEDCDPKDTGAITPTIEVLPPGLYLSNTVDCRSTNIMTKLAAAALVKESEIIDQIGAFRSQGFGKTERRHKIVLGNEITSLDIDDLADGFWKCLKDNREYYRMIVLNAQGEIEKRIEEDGIAKL